MDLEVVVGAVPEELRPAWPEVGTESALADSDRYVHELTDHAEDPLAAFVDWYLSAEHRDTPGTGCAVPALGGDVRRVGALVLSRAVDDEVLSEEILSAVSKGIGEPR